MKRSVFSTSGRSASVWALLAVALVSRAALADVSNSVPKAFSFETYTNNEVIVGTDGWYGEDGAMFAVETNQAFGLQKPLAGPHDVVAKITGAVTNVFDGNASVSNVWIDLLIQPLRWQQEEMPTGYPSDAQTVVFFDTNGHINALCSFWDDDLQDYVERWATFGQHVVESNDWVRLTVALKYLAAENESYFQIQVNNSSTLTNRFGQSYPGAYDTDGEWFYCANRTAASLNAVAFNGQSYVDDLVVTNEAPEMADIYNIRVVADAGSFIDGSPGEASVDVLEGESITFTITADVANGYELEDLWWGVGTDEADATNAVAITNATSMACAFGPVSNDYILVSEAWRPGWEDIDNIDPTSKNVSLDWLTRYGFTDKYPSAELAQDGHDDDDGVLNWEEFVAGTDPTNSASYFRMLDLGHGSPENFITYYVTTNSGVMDPVDIYRSTNLLENGDGAWGYVATTNRNESGTNTWWDLDAPADVPAFYKAVIEWEFNP